MVRARARADYAPLPYETVAMVADTSAAQADFEIIGIP